MSLHVLWIATVLLHNCLFYLSIYSLYLSSIYIQKQCSGLSLSQCQQIKWTYFVVVANRNLFFEYPHTLYEGVWSVCESAGWLLHDAVCGFSNLVLLVTKEVKWGVLVPLCRVIRSTSRVLSFTQLCQPRIPGGTSELCATSNGGSHGFILLSTKMVDSAEDIFFGYSMLLLLTECFDFSLFLNDMDGSWTFPTSCALISERRLCRPIKVSIYFLLLHIACNSTDSV